MKHRLLYLVGQLQPGGLERQLTYLLQGMDRTFFKPAVAVWNFSEDDIYVNEIRKLGVPVYFFSKGASRIRKLQEFRSLLRNINPEIVHSYSFFTNFAAKWGAWGTRAIPIGSVRSDFLRAKKDCGPLLGSLSARWPCIQIYNNYSAAKQAQNSKSIFVPKKIFVVRNGLDVKHFSLNGQSISDTPIILGVGSLYGVKRWDRLLEAAAEIKRKDIKFYLQFAGDGPLRQVLQQQAEELGISSCVEFVGHSQDIMVRLQKARILVHTSDSEGCPNVIMEAMACGRPVVATNAGDISSLVDDGKTGFVVPLEDQESLIQCICYLLQNRSLCIQMGTAAREKAEKEFGIERMVKETMESYRAAGWIC